LHATSHLIENQYGLVNVKPQREHRDMLICSATRHVLNTMWPFALTDGAAEFHLAEIHNSLVNTQPQRQHYKAQAQLLLAALTLSWPHSLQLNLHIPVFTYAIGEAAACLAGLPMISLYRILSLTALIACTDQSTPVRSPAAIGVIVSPWAQLGSRMQLQAKKDAADKHSAKTVFVDSR